MDLIDLRSDTVTRPTPGMRKAMAAETLASLSDCELVERFLASHDEASFQALLQRR